MKSAADRLDAGFDVLCIERVLLEFHESPIHGTGGFAATDISAGTRVIEYLGELISKQESLALCAGGNTFIFHFNSEFDLDGNVSWNPARWLNHSCSPNCDAEFIEGNIWLVARRDIRAGEEITFDYGYDLENFREYPCRCGAPNCSGVILAQEFRKLLS